MRKNRFSLCVELYLTPSSYVPDLRLTYRTNLTKEQVMKNFYTISREVDYKLESTNSSVKVKWLMAEDMYGKKRLFTELNIKEYK